MKWELEEPIAEVILIWDFYDFYHCFNILTRAHSKYKSVGKTPRNLGLRSPEHIISLSFENTIQINIYIKLTIRDRWRAIVW
jgi:hypothetical protein